MNKDNSTKDKGLKIRLFGGLDVRSSQGELQTFATKKAELLFVFLVLNANRLFYRDSLLERFFADEATATARKNLRTVIWQIRSVLEPKGTKSGTYLIVNNREVGFNGLSDYWLDCQQFKAGMSGQNGSLNIECLSELVKLYRGEFLEGVADDWCDTERDHLKTMYLDALERLMRMHAENGKWLEAIRLGEKVIVEDPFKEHVYRHLMRYYYFLGDRPSAMIKYQACVRVLRDELDIEPMAKTMRLFRDIQNEKLDAVSGLTSPASAKSFSTGLPSTTSPSATQATDQSLVSLSEKIEKMEQTLASGLRLIEKLSVNS